MEVRMTGKAKRATDNDEGGTRQEIERKNEEKGKREGVVRDR
jgi:hypothetical protein